MTIEMIPLKNLAPQRVNPRKSFDERTIAGLAQSIRTDGLLQNFVAAKPQGRKRKFPLISGERRYRAMQLLIEEGHLPKDVTVPVEVRDGLSVQDTLRIATIENVQRENLAPMDEAAAIATLVQDGGKLEDIVSQTGLSVSTLRRRMALLNLSDTAKEALAEGRITLAQAEALSVGDHARQDDLLGGVERGWYDSAEDIRDRLLGDLPSVSAALFDRDAYDGSFTTDLFGDDDTTYFNDVEQFHTLQKIEAEKLVREHDRKADWAMLIEGRFENWQYRKAEDGESGGVVVCLTPEGAVEIHDGLIRRDIDGGVADALKSKPKPSYTKPVCEYFAMQKSAAVQAALIDNPRKAQEIGAAQLLYRAATHPCLRYLAELGEDAPALEAIEAEAAALCNELGIGGKDVGLGRLLSCARSMEAGYDLVQRLTDDDLIRLFAFLSAIRFGQENTSALDTREGSVFNRVADDLSVDMRSYWMPAKWFLSRRTTKQLGSIIREAGLSRLFGSGAAYKKGELVTALARYFRKVRSFDQPAPDQLQARDWLPEAMSFPAIDPDDAKADGGSDSGEEATAKAA